MNRADKPVSTIIVFSVSEGGSDSKLLLFMISLWLYSSIDFLISASVAEKQFIYRARRPLTPRVISYVGL